MADTKISALPAATSALTTDEVPVNESGVTKKVTVAQIVAAGAGSGASSLPSQPGYGNARPFFYTVAAPDGQPYGWVQYDGTRWLTISVYPISLGTYIQVVTDGTTASAAIAQTHSAELTGLPVAGVVAVMVNAIILGGVTANSGNSVQAFDYGRSDGEAGVQTHGDTLVSPYFHAHHGIVLTGGTNNRKIDYAVSWVTNFQYYLRVDGYWAHLIAT